MNIGHKLMSTYQTIFKYDPKLQSPAIVYDMFQVLLNTQSNVLATSKMFDESDTFTFMKCLKVTNLKIFSHKNIKFHLS